MVGSLALREYIHKIDEVSQNNFISIVLVP